MGGELFQLTVLIRCLTLWWWGGGVPLTLGGWCATSYLCLCPGGLGEAVLSAVGEEPGIVVTRLAVNRIPRSGKPQELLDLYGISAKHIVDSVRQTFAN